MANPLDRAVRWWARETPQAPAFVAGDDVATYAEVDAWVDRVARRMIDAGVQVGDRVGLVGATPLEWCAAALGVLRSGAVLAPFNSRLVAKELDALFSDCAPTLVIAADSHTDRLDEVAGGGHRFDRWNLAEIGDLRTGERVQVTSVDVPDDDPMALIYTSGTTGVPKGVTFTSRRTSAYYLECALVEPTYSRDIRMLAPLPLWGTPGLYSVGSTVLFGGTLHILGTFDAAAALNVLTEHRINALVTAVIIWERIAAVPGFEDADLSSLAYAGVGGSRVPQQVLAQWLRKGVKLRQCYGLSESHGPVTITTPEDAAKHPESCGRGGLLTEIKVVRPDGSTCEPDEIGEIVVRGPSVTRGYWANEAATTATIVDGWLHTGDLGATDEDGRLRVVDRLKDIIISGGINIASAEIEEAIAELDEIEEVAVLGAPDAKFGETPAAVVRLRRPIAVEAIIAHCNRRLADFKVPRYVIVVEEPLPRTGATEKLAKQQIREMFDDIPANYPRVR